MSSLVPQSFQYLLHLHQEEDFYLLLTPSMTKKKFNLKIMTNNHAITTTTTTLLQSHVPIPSMGILGFRPNIKKNCVYLGRPASAS